MTVFALFYILSRAQVAADVVPPVVGLYAALVYCRKNYYVLSLCYIAACSLAGFDYASLIFAGSGAVIFGIAKFVHYKMAVPMRMPFVTAYALASAIPLIVLRIVYKGAAIAAVASAVQTGVFTFLCCIACYAVTVRGVGSGFSYDEKAGLAVIVAAIGLGLFGINLWGWQPYYTVLGALVLLCVRIMPTATGAGCSVAFALGAAIATKDAGYAGAVTVIWAASACFTSQSRWISAIAEICAYLLCGYVLDAFAVFDVLNICLFCAGVLAAAVIPKSASTELSRKIFPPADGAVRYAVNRDRQELFARIGGMAKIFMDMADAFGCNDGYDPDYAAAVCSDMERKICKGCPDRAVCVELGEGGNHIFMPLVKRTMEGGKASGEDLPLHVLSRCNRLDSLLRICDDEIKQAQAFDARHAEARAGSMMIAGQMSGIGRMLGDLATRISKGGVDDGALDEKIKSELGYENIACYSVAVLGSGEDTKISLTVRSGDEKKKALASAVGKAVKARLRISECVPTSGSEVTVTLVRCAPYALAYGKANAVKPGGSAAGDTCAVSYLRGDKVLIAVCDGMGSGEGPQKESALTLSMVESFYKCGFDTDTVLALINRFLSARGGEKFCALDICVVDMNDAVADFIKLGGVESYIMRSDRVRTLRGSALPIGILDEIKPYHERVQLTAGDVIVMVSDGITDALTPQGTEYTLGQIQAGNPRKICDLLLASAIKNDLKDDATVLAVKIYNN